MVYDTYILPYFSEYEERINNLEKQAKDKLAQADGAARSFIDDKKRS